MKDTPSYPQDLTRRFYLAIFNDREEAFRLRDQLSASPAPDLPFEIRLCYHICSAFLDNQTYHYETALQRLDLAEAIVEQIADRAQLAEIWLDRVAVFANLEQWNEAQNALDQARKNMRRTTDRRLKAHYSAREGLLHLRLNNLGQALEYLLEAEKILTLPGVEWQLKDWYVLTLVVSGLGELYESRTERDKSLEAYQRVLPIAEEHRLWPRLHWHFLNMGRAALVLDDYAEAKHCFEKALQLAHPTEQEVKAIALTNLGILALMSSDFSDAAARFDAGAALFSHPQRPEDFDNLSKTEWWRAELFRQTEGPDKVEEYLLRAFEAGEKGHDRFHLRRICQKLSDLYAENSLHEQALAWQRKATAYTDEHYHKLRENERNELEARYQLERSRQEAQMARLRVAGLQSRALRAQMNPHFLFNSLNAIQGFITSGRDTDASTYLARFAKFMRQTLEYSELEEVQLEDEIKFIEKYLEINCKLRFSNQLEYEVSAPGDLDTNELLVPAMIIQPFVENAIEHGLRPLQRGRLTVTFAMTDDERCLLCVIEDNGVGFNKGREKQAAHKAEHQTHRSKGMEITRERLALLHGVPGGHFVRLIDLSDLTHGAQNGTRVEVILPLLDEKN